jgi:hypothetical protein
MASIYKRKDGKGWRAVVRIKGHPTVCIHRDRKEEAKHDASEKDVEKEISEGMSEELALQEYYCSFDRGVEGAYYTRLIDQARRENRIGRVPYDPSVSVDTFWDVGYSDSTTIIFGQPMKSFLSQIPIDRFQRVPCHNDPSPENFFHQDGHLYLHDWELARSKDPMWDLAHLSVIGQVEPEEILRFYPTSDPLAREKIVLFRAFVFFNTIIWAALEREKPSLSLPKETVDMLYRIFLEKTNTLMKSAPFQTALKKLLKEQTI